MCAALNPYYPASFGLSGNAVAAVAAAAAAAVFSNNAPNIAPILPSSSNNNPSAPAAAVATQPGNRKKKVFFLIKNISRNDLIKAPNYQAEKVEWMNKIENSHIDRALMNKLIMNYLVNG